MPAPPRRIARRAGQVARRGALLGALLLFGCGGDDEAGSAPPKASATAPATAAATAAEADPGQGQTQPGTGSSTDPTAIPSDNADPAVLAYEVIGAVPHDPDAFTQGLLLAPDGRLFEATGYDSPDPASTTTVRQVEPDSGAVIDQVDLGRSVFGEGLALVEDRLVQLTWQDGVAFVYDADTLDQVGQFSYHGEGWGLCYDGAQLVMSDGTATLAFRDPESFAVEHTVLVTLGGAALERLNELECVDGSVWANIWLTDTIVRIDPTSGEVTGTLDAAGLIEPHPAAANADAVLNGIAYDREAGTFLLTGKRWPTLFEVRITEVAPG